MAAYAELRELVGADHTPPRVKATCLGLSQHQTKLFCTVLESNGAKDGAEPIDDARTPDGQGEVIVGLRLEPSNFLLELLAAMRALEWPKVLVLIHGLTPPAGNEHSAENTGPPREVSVQERVPINFATGVNSDEWKI
jgi:hypothetical protein